MTNAVTNGTPSNPTRPTRPDPAYKGCGSPIHDLSLSARVGVMDGGFAARAGGR